MTQPPVIVTGSSGETQSFGRRLGSLLQAGDLLLLSGPLGSGKTTFAQGVAWGVGVSGYAHSPTFMLVHEYAGRVPLYHIDLYRLEGGDLEAGELGIEEMLAEGACVVEWAEKALGAFPADHLSIVIEFGAEPDHRRLTLAPHGARYKALLAQLPVTAR